MADKEIVDGADATIIAELDEAAEARIIDVLSKVFVTNKYPGLRAAILDGAERYKHQKAVEEQQRQYRFFQQEAVLNGVKNSILKDSYGRDYIAENQKAIAAQTAAAPKLNSFDRLTGFGKKYW